MSETIRKANIAVYVPSAEAITWASVLIVVSGTILWLTMNDAVWWPPNSRSIWSGEIWSSSNSQHPIDPYTVTHTMFGILCFWITSLFLRQLPLSRQFFLAVCAACFWEIVENSSFFIDRFRHATAAAEYLGDALVNSTTDIAACGIGFYLATKIKTRTSILIFLFAELFTAIIYGDNLILNILMLCFPIDSVRTWQLGS